MIDAAGPGAGFEAGYRVRFDEAGPDGRLRTSGLLRYTQDLAAQHSEALGYDRAWYAARGLTWLVRAAEIDVSGPIPYGVNLVGTTRVAGFRRVWSRRESRFLLDGTVVAAVRIDWVLLDRRGTPTRIPPEFEAFFPAGEPNAPIQLGRVTLDPAPEGAARRTIEVRPQELDPLDHVNNAVYADWFDEAVAAAEPDESGVAHTLPRRVRLEYALAAEPADMLESVTWRDETGWASRIVRSTSGADLLRARIEAG
jgi:acyl-ACP thioesterase